MKKPWMRRIGFLCVLALLVSMMSGVAFADAAITAPDDAPVKEIVPVDALPVKPIIIDPGMYGYDDLSQPVTIEFLAHNYGVANSDPDPIATYIGNKYNATITYNTINASDYETVISTRFAAQDYPDCIITGAGNRRIIQPLFDQGLVMDAKKAMYYMPNFVQYFTKDYAQYITYNGGYPAAPRYQIQAEWGPFLRTDWLTALNMKMPSTLDELLDYARKVTKEDPDGNGQADTWFAGGAGNGQSFGMLDSLRWYFGYSGYSEKDGKVSNMIMDGTMKEFLTYIKQLNDEGLLSPDWYTIDWETFKSYSLNGQIGFVNYPASNIHQEQMDATGGRTPDNTSWHRWIALPPIGTGKAAPAPGPSYMFVFPTKLEEDQVKFKRITHILDQSLWGGADYFDTIQGGGNNVFGKQVFDIINNEDGTAFFSVNQKLHPDWTGELDTTGLANAGWQIIGLGGPWMLSYFPGFEEGTKVVAEDSLALAQFPKWANNYLAQPDASVETDLAEFERIELPKFVLGTRSLDEYDAFVQEWLAAGGDAALTKVAEQMGLANYK